MKKTLLTSLAGLTVAAAKKAVKAAGHKAMVLPEGAITTLIARPGTVMIYHNASNIVTSAHAGDPLELE